MYLLLLLMPGRLDFFWRQVLPLFLLVEPGCSNGVCLPLREVFGHCARRTRQHHTTSDRHLLSLTRWGRWCVRRGRGKHLEDKSGQGYGCIGFHSP